MKYCYAILLFCLIGLLTSGDVALAQAPEVDGLVTVQATESVDETVSELQKVIEERGLILLATVNHAANAANVEQELRPTQLIIFGNPKLGTKLMQNQQTVGIDLPQKFLVWEDETGQVNISYNSPDYLQHRHGLTGPAEVLTTVSKALAGLSSTVASETEMPMASSAKHASISPGLLIASGLGLAGTGFIIRQPDWSYLLAPLLLTGVQSDVEPPSSNGLVSVDSPYTVEETVSRLETTMTERGLTIMATINHAANAEKVGLELRPTQLIIFGNPKLGTQLMQSSQTTAIDLPQKYLVWEDETGQVHLTYNDPQYLASRHGIGERDDVLTTITNALGGLAEAASTP